MPTPHPRRFAPSLIPLAVLSLTLQTPLLHAQQSRLLNFQPLTNSNWGDPANWTDAFNPNLHLVPTSIDRASISSATPRDIGITLNGTFPVRGLSVSTNVNAILLGAPQTSRTLELGFGGISVATSSAFSSFDASPSLRLTANQTWSISGFARIQAANIDNAGFDLYINNASNGLCTLGSTLQGNSTGLSGPGSITFAGGSNSLTGTNTYTGRTTLEAGNLNLGVNAALATTSAITFTGGTLGFSSDSTDYSPKILDSTSPISLDLGGRTITFASPLSASNTGGLSVINFGTLILTANNTYSGPTSISGAISALQIGNGGTTGSVPGNISSNGTLRFNRSDNYTFTGVISGTGSVVHQGPGTTTLTGPSNYTGPTSLNAGTLILRKNTAFASSTTTISNPATLELNSSDTPFDNWRINTTLAGNGTINKTGPGWIQTGTNAHSFSGTFNLLQGTFGASFLTSNWTGITADFHISPGTLLDARGQAITVGSLNGSGTAGTTFNTPSTLTVGAGNKSGSFSGIIAGNASSPNSIPANPNAGTLALIKIGTGTQTLTGNNTYSGGTTISAGTLQLGDGGTTGSVPGNIANNASLIVNRSDNYTFTGVISGTGSVIHQGPGTTTLTGPSNYTGPTSLNAGTLVLRKNTAFASSTTTISNPATLELHSSDTAVDNWRVNTTLTGNGTINKTGPGWIQTTTKPHSFSGTFNLLQGTFGASFLTSNWTGITADFHISPGALLDARGQAITVGSLNGSGAVGTTYNTPSILTIGAGNKSGSFSGIIAGNATSPTNIPDNPNAATLALIKSGTGTQILSGNNTYSGGTTLLGGILAVSSDANLGAPTSTLISGVGGSGTLRILGTAFTTTSRPIAWGGFGGTLDIDHPDNTFTLAQPFSFFLTKSGPGKLILTGTSTLSNLAISAGTLQIGNGGTTGSLSTPITNNASLIFNRANNLTFPHPISGTGSLTQAGPGTLTLSGPLTYTGNTSITSGKLILLSPLNTPTSDLLLSPNTSLEFATPRSSSPTLVSTLSKLTIPNNAIATITPSPRTASTQQVVLIVSTLSITSSGFLDLTNNDLILRNQPLDSTRSLVATWLTAANGLPGTTGLGSSAAFYTPEGAFTTLAVYDNSLPSQTLPTFNNIPVLPTDVLVKYTYHGDTNLDGIVNATDLARLLQGLNAQGSGWNFGDVNYDGLINFTDLGRTLAALRGQGSPLTDIGSGGAGGTIPEPTSLALLSPLALLLPRPPRATSTGRRLP